MRLLVSVRSAAEVDAAARRRGRHHRRQGAGRRARSAPVSGRSLREHRPEVPAAMPLSVALGDPKDVAALEAAMAASGGSLRGRSRVYVKLGLRGGGRRRAGELLSALVDLAARTPIRPSVVAVAYADYVRGRRPRPRDGRAPAAAAGADGVLLDTCEQGRPRPVSAPGRARASARGSGEARAARLLVGAGGLAPAEGVRAVGRAAGRTSSAFAGRPATGGRTGAGERGRGCAAARARRGWLYRASLEPDGPSRETPE